MAAISISKVVVASTTASSVAPSLSWISMRARFGRVEVVGYLSSQRRELRSRIRGCEVFHVEGADRQLRGCAVQFRHFLLQISACDGQRVGEGEHVVAKGVI